MNKIMSQINDILICERLKLTCVLRRSHIISITSIVTLHEQLKIHTGSLFADAMSKFLETIKRGSSKRDCRTILTSQKKMARVVKCGKFTVTKP